MLSRLFRRFRRKAEADTSLSFTNRTLDLSCVMPVILPLELTDIGWPGPIVRIGALPFAMAWADCAEGNRFFYITQAEAQAWEDAGIDWQATAFDNLSRHTMREQGFGEKCDEHGRPFVKVMLQRDALGPSRLLLPHLFDTILGSDYRVAIPERTCAIAFRRDLTPAQAVDITGIIDGCYQHGTEPMSPERFDAHQFWHIDAR